MRSFKLLCASLLLVASATVTSVVAAPQFRSELVHRRACGVHISAARKAASESRFSRNRMPGTDPKSTATLDVFMHVVFTNKTREGGYIPNETLLQQIQVLNNDYSSTGVSFKLVNITRIQSPEWFSGVSPGSPEERQMKQRHRYGNASALNVWTVGFEKGEGAGLLGYATFPSDFQDAPQDDGVVVLHTTLPGGPKPPYNKGRTLTHESGHWAGLYHTFESGCAGKGDFVDDTPAQREATYGCPAAISSCSAGKKDPISNFMNYSDDTCLNEFTAGQRTRIRTQLRTFRKVKI
jgi:hypothetical protein